MTAVLLPVATDTSLLMPLASRGVAPRDSAVLEGIRPEDPPEPPRTTDEG